MTAPILMALTSPPRAFLAATVAAWKGIRACPNPAAAGIDNFFKKHAGEAPDTLPSCEQPMDLGLDGWQDLSWPLLKIPELQPASDAALVTHNVDPCPEMGLPTRAHPAVRKKGI